MDASEREIMTLAEVSEMTSIPKATLRYWRHLGDQGPKSFTLGNRVVYKRADVDAWINEQYERGVGGAK